MIKFIISMLAVTVFAALFLMWLALFPFALLVVVSMFLNVEVNFLNLAIASMFLIAVRGAWFKWKLRG